MDLFKKILLIIFSLQEKILTARLNKTLNTKQTAKRKKVYANGVLLSLDSFADKEREELEAECEAILKTSEFKPEKVLEYIKQQTGVYYIDNSQYLYAIGENQGFIYPQKGLKAIYLSLLIKNKPLFNTPEMFILAKGEINKYIFMYHFYNWFMFKHNIAGIGADEINLLNKYLYNAGEDDINKLQLNDIYKLKDAIAQDKAAINFVIKLCKNFETSKIALEKLKDKGINL